MPDSPSLPHGYGDSSSLDPLADSFDTQMSPVATRSSSPAKRRLSSPVKSSTRKRSSVDRKSMQSPEHVSVIASSPGRTVTEQHLSPWKIRVTVETEPENAETGAGIPVDIKTRTTKIPLRQSSSPTPLDPSSGRGRRSQPVAVKTKRSRTPVRGKNSSRSRSRRQSVTDLDIIVLGDDGDSDEWTGRKKSPRKKRMSSKGRGRSISVDPEGVETTGDVNISRELAFEIHQDENDGILVCDYEERPCTDSPELRQIDLNRVSVRPRPQSTKQKEEQEECHARRSAGTVVLRSSPRPARSSAGKVSANSAVSYPTPSPTSSYPSGSDEVEKAADPTDQDEGFDTILESEGFTMIDLNSVPSARNFLNTPPDSQTTDTGSAPVTTSEQRRESDAERRQAQPSPPVKPSPIPKYMARVDEESELSSNVPSSPPAIAESSMLQIPQHPSSGMRKVTPLQYSSPKLPSPPRPTRKSPKCHQRTISKEAVTAGMALQGIVSPEKEDSRSLCNVSSLQKTPASSKEEELYSGFSSGTKRELRAGLRFGEELAKRQKQKLSPLNPTVQEQNSHAPPLKNKLDAQQMRPVSTSTQVWRGEALVRHSSPLAASNGYMQTKSDTQDSLGAGMFNVPLSNKMQTNKAVRSSMDARIETPKSSSSKNIESGSEILDTDARREHEWQLEREAISRQIESASPSKVVVIDSDDDGKEEEAKSKPEAKEGRAEVRREDFQKERYDQDTSGRRQSDIRGASPSQRQHQNVHPRSTDTRSHTGETSGGVEAQEHQEDDGDIWLEEANAGSSSPRDVIIEDHFTRSEQERQRKRAVEVINKPRRSLLPSPWKKGEGIEASTLISVGETSGMLWQQPRNTGFGAGDIAQAERGLDGTGSGSGSGHGIGSGNFDLERMLSSPVKYAKPGRKFSMELKIDGLSQDLRSPDQQDDESQEELREDEEESIQDNTQGDTSESLGSEESVPSSPPQPTKVPVKFNDSTLSHHQTTPPPLTRSNPTEDSDERPPTPRSALKGARQSFDAVSPQNSPRKVVFSQRSMCLNEDGVESSMSAKLDSPQIEQSHPLDGEQHELEEIEEGEQLKRSGWMGWLWKGKLADEFSQIDTTLTSQATLQLDGSHGSPHEDRREEEQQWQPTKTAMASGPSTSRPEPSQQPRTKKHKQADSIPSYLKPPSYPSDPNRSPATPLSSSGEFTNSHFRTLHIIYAKSQRPRFHAPKHIRGEVQALLGWKMELDMTESDMDVFEWQVGDRECEVLERFMQEVEWSQVQGRLVESAAGVEWGWKGAELASRLGMVVIGEVVRREEGGR